MRFGRRGPVRGWWHTGPARRGWWHTCPAGRRRPFGGGGTQAPQDGGGGTPPPAEPRDPGEKPPPGREECARFPTDLAGGLGGGPGAWGVVCGGRGMSRM